MKRVLRPDGIASHQIDFRDHLQYALNNLRFSERFWESDFMAESGFYTNRIPWTKMQATLEEHFRVSIKHRNFWSSLPTAQEKMSLPFTAMPKEDLMTLDCHAVITNKFLVRVLDAISSISDHPVIESIIHPGNARSIESESGGCSGGSVVPTVAEGASPSPLTAKATGLPEKHRHENSGESQDWQFVPSRSKRLKRYLLCHCPRQPQRSLCCPSFPSQGR